MAGVRRGGRALRWSLGVVGALIVVALVGGLWVRGRVAASLPLLDGEIIVAGLPSPVTVTRDDRGIPTVIGAERTDVAFATGFLHAQERFFQMDLMRRRAAGELAELFGNAALMADQSVRRHRFRAVAEAALAAAGPAERRVVEAYTAGVNAGLSALAERPFEYLPLRVAPVPWREEDSALVVLSMYLVLQDDSGSHESLRGLMEEMLPPEMVAFLCPPGTEWDAPVAGDGFTTPGVPGPEVLDLRGVDPAELAPAASLPLPSEAVAGSNNWAVAGSRTGDGRALLANDPHLPLGVPNIWYRATLVWAAAVAGEARVSGVTLPGIPPVVIGSNGRVAWGFTNSQGDYSDVILVETDPDDPERYLTPDGPRRIERHAETIRVKGGEDVVLDVEWTIWGPLLGTDPHGRRRAFRWVAHEAAGAGLGMLAFETAASVEEMLALGNRVGMPEQNLVCADADGHIGWTITGLVPRRVGHDGRVPSTWTDGTRGWDGFLPPEEVPRIVDPPDGLIWTANARVVSGQELRTLGDGGYDLGARARQIRDDLRAATQPTVGEMLAMQTDDRALFLTRWRTLLLDLLSERAVAGAPARAELRRLVRDGWNGHASVASAGYRLVREFRSETARRVFAPLTAACAAADPDFNYFRATSQYEGPLWRLVSERPPHLLSPELASWEEQLLAAADAVIERLTENGAGLATVTWGARNTVRIRHPLSGALPVPSSWLDMEAVPLPGDSHMPRVQTPTFGASMRMAVTPGRESEGLLHMPCGESGHPLSPTYRAGHEEWARGEPAPLLPGRTAHTLVLRPAGRGR